MRLNQIVNESLHLLSDSRALDLFYSPDELAHRKHQLSRAMPKYKQEHSRRVAGNLARANLPTEVIDAGWYHDYLERGGDPNDLAHLNDYSQQLVHHMTNPNKDTTDDPLTHLKQVIPILPPAQANHLILLKLSDRVDNLQRRVREDRLTKSYLKYSRRLIRWLESQFTGDRRQWGAISSRLLKHNVSI